MEDNDRMTNKQVDVLASLSSYPCEQIGSSVATHTLLPALLLSAQHTQCIQHWHSHLCSIATSPSTIWLMSVCLSVCPSLCSIATSLSITWLVYVCPSLCSKATSPTIWLCLSVCLSVTLKHSNKYVNYLSVCHSTYLGTVHVEWHRLSTLLTPLLVSSLELMSLSGYAHHQEKGFPCRHHCCPAVFDATTYITHH